MNFKHYDDKQNRNITIFMQINILRYLNISIHFFKPA